MDLSKLSAAAAACLLAVSFATYAQTPAAGDVKPKRDLNEEPRKQMSHPPAPPEVQKEKRDKIQTKEQQQRAMQEYQTRSASSASGAVAVDKSAAKSAKPKPTSKMTREEQNARLREAQKASTP